MKHKITITLILLGMFLITQFIGLYVISSYSHESLPYGMQPPELEAAPSLISIIISFIIAIVLILILTKYKWKFLIRLWFFIVVVLALGISLNSFLKSTFAYAYLTSLIFALVLAYIKIYKRNIYIHNLTELLIYPGIAAVFVPLLNIWSIIILLIAISIYDIWAVWHSGIMQKMAQFQMQEVGVFGGFLVPYLPKKLREKLRKIRQQKSKALKKTELKNQKIKISIALLGGGDIVFPIITAGVVLRALGLIPALFVILGAFSGLLYLLLISEKKKFYPAMPFITAGIFLGMLISYLII